MSNASTSDLCGFLESLRGPTPASGRIATKQAKETPAAEAAAAGRAGVQAPGTHNNPGDTHPGAADTHFGPADTTDLYGAHQREDYFPWEFCEDCGVLAEGDAGGALNMQVEFACPECGCIFRRPPEEELALMDHPDFNGNVKSAPRLRVVGPDAMRTQRRLDRSFSANSEEAGYRDLLAQLRNFNKEFREKTGKEYPEHILRTVALVYVQEVRSKRSADGKMRVKRGQNKQSMLAMLVFMQSRDQGWTSQDAAALMGLNSSGLARGESQLRLLSACLDLLNDSRESSFVEAAFLAAGLVYRPHSTPRVALVPEDEPHVDEAGRALIDTLKRAALDLLDVCDKKHLGTQSVARTRAAAATYVVLRRAALAGRIPAGWNIPTAPAPGQRGSLAWLADCCSIRTQTIEGFLDTLHRYHRQFRPTYKKWELDDRRVYPL